jgi:hypothetical protein
VLSDIRESRDAEVVQEILKLSESLVVVRVSDEQYPRRAHATNLICHIAALARSEDDSSSQCVVVKLIQ